MRERLPKNVDVAVHAAHVRKIPHPDVVDVVVRGDDVMDYGGAVPPGPAHGDPGVPEPADLVVADGGVADHLRQHTAPLLPDDCACENTARKGRQYERPDGSATQMSHPCETGV